MSISSKIQRIAMNCQDSSSIVLFCKITNLSPFEIVIEGDENICPSHENTIVTEELYDKIKYHRRKLMVGDKCICLACNNFQKYLVIDRVGGMYGD